MPNLTATAWSEQVLVKLRSLEETCADADLFCVGYLIPPVELVEMNQASEVESPETWHQWYAQFIEDMLSEDQVGEQDAIRILEIVETLAPA